MNAQHGFSCWLVRRAAAAAPPSLAERLEEEWLADLETRQSSASRLLFALGCCWAVPTIARDFPGKALAASAAGGGQATVFYGQHVRPSWSNRPGALFVIVAFHVVVIFAFASIFNGGTPLHEPPIIKGSVLTIPRPVDPPLPKPSKPLVETHVAPLNLPGGIVFAAEPTGITFTGQPEIRIGGSVADVKRVSGGPGAGFPNAEEFYPAAAKRLGEQGVAAVRVCVDGNGRLTELPTVAQSAGSARLDEGALRLALAGSGHYRPATENGRAVNSCFAFRVRFQIR